MTHLDLPSSHYRLETVAPGNQLFDEEQMKRLKSELKTIKPRVELTKKQAQFHKVPSEWKPKSGLKLHPQQQFLKEQLQQLQQQSKQLQQQKHISPKEAVPETKRGKN